MLRQVVNKFTKKRFQETDISDESGNEASAIEPVKPTISAEEIIAELENNSSEIIKKRKEWFNPNNFSDEQLAALLDVTIRKGLLSIAHMFLKQDHSSRQVRDRLKQQLEKFNFTPYEINGVYKGKYNILQLCVIKGRSNLFEWLVTEKKHSIAQAENNGIDLFLLAATHGRLKIMQILGDLRPKGLTLSAYIRDYCDGGSLLIQMAKLGRVQCVKWLIANARYFNNPKGHWDCPPRGRSWLNTIVYQMYEMALEHGQNKFIDYLLQHTGVNISKNGSSILHLFIRHNDLERVKILVDQGCIITTKDNKGDEPIHLAARLGRFDVLTYILKKRQNSNSETRLRDRKNSYGETILEIAESVGHQEIVQWILQQKKMPVPVVPESPIELAAMLNKKGDKLLSKSKRLAYGYYLQAVRIQSAVVDEDKTSINCYILATYLNNVGLAAPDQKEKLGWYQAAIKAVSEMPEEDRTAKHWRSLATMHSNLGLNVEKDNFKACYKAAYDCMCLIPEEERTAKDLLNLQNYAHRAGFSEEKEMVTENVPDLSQQVDDLKNEIMKLQKENKELVAEMRSYFAGGLTTFGRDPSKGNEAVVAIVDTPAIPVLKLA